MAIPWRRSYIRGTMARSPGRAGPCLGLGQAALLLSALLVTATVAGEAAAAGARPASVVTHGAATTRTVALTFDDGWHPGRCARIMGTLLHFGVPATWFPNAAYVNRSPALWRRIAERFPIANHTSHHRSLPSLSGRRLRREITSDERRIERVTGRPMSRILRPPYGSYDRRVLRVARRLGYPTVALWDVSAADTSKRGTDRGVARMALRGRAGSIVLMHCGPAVTPRILPAVIARYACLGYRFATLEDLLAGAAGVRATVACPPPALPGDALAGTPDPSPAPSDPEPVEGIEGREWRLVEAAPLDGLVPVPARDVFTLRFGPSTASGHIGCDAYSARVSIEPPGSLSFGRFVRSAEACDAGAPLAMDYQELLAATVGYLIGDGVLELLDRGGLVRLRFTASAPTGVLGDWIVVAMAEEAGTLTVVRGAAPVTVTFGATGSLRGSTGCDTFIGGYSTRDHAVTAGPLLVGPASCGDELDALQARFLAAMRSIASWELRGPILVLRDATGLPILMLTPRSP
jgi:peptidoglycan-N-acetylmuramic acid deacetylase